MSKFTIFETRVPMQDGSVSIIIQTLEDDIYLCWYVDGVLTKKLEVLDPEVFMPKIAREYLSLYNQYFYNDSSNLFSVLEWYSVNEKLPEIPEYVVEYDSVYEEICPGHGKTIHDCLYSSTTDREGRRFTWFKGTDKEFDFMELYSSSTGSEWGPLGDRPLFWAYQPNVNHLPVLEKD